MHTKKARKQHLNNMFNFLAFSCFFLVALVHQAGAYYHGGNWIEEACVDPMGMESGRIPSTRITASSSFDEKSVGPQNARIRQELYGGAWCPKTGIEDGVKEFLEIDFAGEYRVTQTETQGRFGNGVGKEFAEQFMLEYYRDSVAKWIQYKDHLGRTIFDANKNTYLGVVQKLNPPIIANRLRFIPYSMHLRTVCMRVESYGCEYTDGIIHYDAPQGSYKKNTDIDLRDKAYDGYTDDNGMLRGGLGLLVDTLLGPTDFRTSETQGNMWIGWDEESDPVKIAFQFDTFRKFYEVSIHVNNFVSQGAQVFESVDVFFSMDGHRFSEVPLEYSPKVDLKNETAQLITIGLQGRIASYVRMEFHHSDHWLLISEIMFHSDIFTGNVTDEILAYNFLQDGPNDKSIRNNNKKGDNGKASNVNGSRTGTIVGLIAGSLSVFALLSIVTLVCYVMRRNRRNTKLVGVMGMTPKSMSIGLGCNDLHHHGGSADIFKDPPNDHYHGQYSTTSSKLNGGTTNNGKMTMGKIPLCDLKPVSIGRRENNDDDSMYHELVFGGINNLREETGLNNTSRKNNTSKKIKYSRVNHGGDFNEFPTLRNLHHEDLNYYHQSTPSTPASKQKQSATLLNGLVPTLRQGTSSSAAASPATTNTTQLYHLPIDHQYSNAFAHQQQYQPFASHHHPLHHTLSSSKSLGGNGNGNLSSIGMSVSKGQQHPTILPSVFTTCSSSKSSSALMAGNPPPPPLPPNSVGYFHSPHRSRRSVGSNLKNCAESNYYAATDIFHVSDKHFDRF